MPALAELQAEYVKQATELWNQSLRSLPAMAATMGAAATPADVPRVQGPALCGRRLERAIRRPRSPRRCIC